MIKYLFLIIFSILYTTNNYSDLFSIIIINIYIIGLSIYMFYINKDKYNDKKKIILSIFISLLISFFIILPTINKYNKNEIIIKNSNHYTTITDIYIDNIKQKSNHKYDVSYDRFNTIELDTEYKKYTKTSSKYKLTLKPNEIYKINIRKSKKIEIQFQRDIKNYNININDEIKTIKKFDSDLNNFAVQIYNSNYIYKFKNTFNNNIFISILIIILLGILNFYYIYTCINNKKNLLYYLPILILEVNPVINLIMQTKIILILIYVIFLSRIKNQYIIKNNKEKIFFVISSFIISFSFLGDTILNNCFNIKILFIYLILSLYIYILLPYIIFKINQIKIKDIKQNKDKAFRHKIIVFSIIIIIGLVYQLIFNPYLVTTDGYMQITDIQKNKFSNWHPYSHTLLMSLFKNLNYFILFRISIYSFVVTKILFFLNEKGMKLKYVYLISIISTLLPTTGVFLVTIVKDVDFTICLTFLTFLIFYMQKDFKKFDSNKINYLLLLISMLGVGLFRHNGLIVIIISILLFLIYSFKSNKKMLRYCLILTLIILFIFEVPIYNKLKVKKEPINFNVATILHGFDYLIHNDSNKIDENTYNYLLKKVSKTEWINIYDKYDIDLMLHYSNSEIRYLKLDKEKLILGYLKQFLITPSQLIKDRLYGTDLIWKVSEGRVNVYKYGIYDSFGVNYSKKLNINYSKNFGFKIINNCLLFMAKSELLNSLFFRVGIFFDLLIILILYCIIYDIKKNLICLIPFLLNILTFFIALHHQEYRYVWNISIIVLLFLILNIFDNKKD